MDVWAGRSDGAARTMIGRMKFRMTLPDRVWIRHSSRLTPGRQFLLPGGLSIPPVTPLWAWNTDLTAGVMFPPKLRRGEPVFAAADARLATFKKTEG